MPVVDEIIKPLSASTATTEHRPAVYNYTKNYLERTDFEDCMQRGGQIVNRHHTPGRGHTVDVRMPNSPKLHTFYHIHEDILNRWIGTGTGSTGLGTTRGTTGEFTGTGTGVSTSFPAATTTTMGSGFEQSTLGQAYETTGGTTTNMGTSGLGSTQTLGSYGTTGATGMGSTGMAGQGMTGTNVGGMTGAPYGSTMGTQSMSPQSTSNLGSTTTGLSSDMDRMRESGDYGTYGTRDTDSTRSLKSERMDENMTFENAMESGGNVISREYDPEYTGYTTRVHMPDHSMRRFDNVHPETFDRYHNVGH